MHDKRENNYILATVVLTSFALPLLLGAQSIALPTIAQELSMTAIQMGWVPLLFSMSGAILVLPFGRLADIVGRKKVYIMGTIISTAAVAVTALSVSAYMLIIFQLMLGIGFSMISSTAPALLTSAYPPQQRGKALGIFVASVYLGTACGPSLGGLLTYDLGWRSIYAPTFLLLAPSILLATTRIKSEWVASKGEKFDYIGSMLIPIMLFCLLFGFYQLPSIKAIWIMAIGIVGVALFIFWELRAESPIFNISHITKNRLFSFSGLTHFLYYTATFPITFIMSLYLQYIKGYNSREAGLILLITPIIMACFSPLAGRTSDKAQPRVNVSAAICIVLIGIVLLFAATFSEGLLLIIVALVLNGLGFAFFVSPNTNAIMSSVDKKYYGVASATQAATRQIGICFSLSLTMLLFSLYIGDVQITPEYYPVFLQSIRTAFVIFSGVSILAIVISATRGYIGHVHS